MADYKKKDLIESGEFGEVFTATKKGVKDVYIMKVIKISNDLDKEVIKNELALIKKISNIHHTNIIQYIDYCFEEDKNQCTIIMEYCPKGSLAKVLKEYSDKKNNILRSQVMKYLFDILSGMEFIHQQNIVHSDLNPENILIDNDGNLKISGFGISKRLCVKKGKKISFIGNPEYSSLEVLNGEEYSASADMWSIGCILYKLCCFKVLYPIGKKQLSEYVKFIKKGKLVIKLPLEYNNDFREFLPIMLETSPSLRKNCTEFLNKEIFQSFAFKRRVVYYRNWDKYDGEYRNGMRNGKGTLYFVDGSKYEGEWIKNKKNGKGTTYYNDGTKVYEEWNKGKLYHMFRIIYK